MHGLAGLTLEGGQDQSAAVGQAARLTDQISGAVQTMALRAQAGAEGSTRAAQTARSGAQTVTDTIQSMHEIKARVTRSADKVATLAKNDLWRVVLDERLYAELSGSAPDATGFFPAYRGGHSHAS